MGRDRPLGRVPLSNRTEGLLVHIIQKLDHGRYISSRNVLKLAAPLAKMRPVELAIAAEMAIATPKDGPNPMAINPWGVCSANALPPGLAPWRRAINNG